MRTLVPQLPPRLLKRLGFEAGVSAGLISMKATLPPEQSTSLIAALDDVIEMLAAERMPRWRTDLPLRAGAWIQFMEPFRFGEAPSSFFLPGHDLVYFIATSDQPSRFLLCGSRVHLLDKRQATEGESDPSGFYTTALLDYARRLAALPDEAATGDPPPLAGIRGRRFGPTSDDDEATRQLNSAIWDMYDQRHRFSGYAVLSGHARVLAVDDFLMATPLYVEYADEDLYEGLHDAD